MREGTNYIKIALITSLIVLIIWGLSFVLFFWNPTIRGTFGDMFGAVNALFSGLAFAGIILTIYMQRDELSLQRKELEETRKVFEQQSNIMSIQQADAQFFSLLENHRQMVHSFDKQYNRSQRAGGGSRISTKEVESGYQFLLNVSEFWREYLSDYSEMYRMKLLYKTEKLEYNPIDLIHSNENIRSYVNETIHLSDFVDRKFGGSSDFDFYSKTLSTSVLESEKFILSAWYDIIVGDKNRSPFGVDVYNNHDFIDFNTHVLPNVEIRLKDEPGSLNYIEFWCTGILLGYYSIIEFFAKIPSEESFEVRKKEIDSVNGVVRLPMIDFLRETSIQIESFPVSEEKLNGLRMRDYFIVFELMYLEEKFYVPLQFQIDEREDFRMRNDEGLKFYQFNFNLRDHNSLSKEKSLELVERIKGRMID